MPSRVDVMMLSMTSGRPELSAVVPGSLRWTAPEVMRDAQAQESADSDVITTACDVYSYGMVLWEMCTALDPFYDIKEDEQVRAGNLLVYMLFHVVCTP